jgi:hypothetical protein
MVDELDKYFNQIVNMAVQNEGSEIFEQVELYFDLERVLF